MCPNVSKFGMSEMEAEENRKNIMENFKSFSEDPELINLSQLWKTVGKLLENCCLKPEQIFQLLKWITREE